MRCADTVHAHDEGKCDNSGRMGENAISQNAARVKCIDVVICESGFHLHPFDQLHKRGILPGVEPDPDRELDSLKRLLDCDRGEFVVDDGGSSSLRLMSSRAVTPSGVVSLTSNEAISSSTVSGVAKMGPPFRTIETKDIKVVRSSRSKVHAVGLSRINGSSQQKWGRPEDSAALGSLHRIGIESGDNGAQASNERE